MILAQSGFGLNMETLRFMQRAYSEPLEALALFAGEKTIVAGMVPEYNGSVYTFPDGFVSFGGEILPFVGSAVPGAELSNIQVTIIEITSAGEFDVDLNNDGQRDFMPKYTTRHMEFGTGGIITFPYADLSRIKTAKQLSELVGNVQSNWEVANPASPAYILNKPTNLLSVLRRGYSYIGNLVNIEKRQISFPSINTANYFVIGVMRSLNDDFGLDGDQTWSIKAKTATYFELVTKEYGGLDQNFRFEYILVPFLPLLTPAQPFIPIS